MKYSERGKHNPYDAYMAGCSIWHSPRQLILLEERLRDYIPADPVDADAIADLYEMIKYEADIKRKKYLEEI